ncbi:MAG: phospholipase phosphocholine-specific [Myxococcaceae bacterium]|nr:phospholipase phosphocholine-specific [Myxococcaceae bacterium]
MTDHSRVPNRREFLRTVAASAAATTALSMFPPAIRKALAIPAHRRTGSLRDVEHILIFMQENRSFDHYFGTLKGVRGFGDRFPIPLPDRPGVEKKTVWYQSTGDAAHPVIAPFRLNTEQTFDYMRVTGTPHTWPNAQNAWNQGSIDQWPRYKNNHSLGYFSEGDIPFQFALAEAFTLCDAYHCSFQGGTNPNRLFAWTGSNDPLGTGHGPALTNDYDNFEHDPAGGYTWTTYCERLEAAGISWQVYQNMEDNFTDNPLAGFRSFRAANSGAAGSLAALKQRGVSTRDLDKLKEDVRNGSLPQVSWIVATAEGSEHPGPSSPAQGASYTARVLDALTENPEVWSKTVLFLMFDENDGFFDHIPPPAAPSYVSYDGDPRRAVLAGDSTVDTTGEYHELLQGTTDPALLALQHRPYGLGPRVPLYVLSPWSKGGWVDSQVFDHTSIIRFVEQRFGVHEPNITPWRRAVCGDLTSTLDFSAPDEDEFYKNLPDTTVLAERARALAATSTPPTPAKLELPQQDFGFRMSRALPYSLYVTSQVHAASASIELLFESHGQGAAVFHVYDRLALERAPRRYTVEAGKQLTGRFDLTVEGAYDLWVLGPNGFHRHFVGSARPSGGLGSPELRVGYDTGLGNLYAVLHNPSARAQTFQITANAYFDESPARVLVAPNAQTARYWWLLRSGHWYDFTVTLLDVPGYARRFAGRVETGRPSISDPVMGGPAHGSQLVF